MNKGWGSSDPPQGISPITFKDDDGCQHTYSIGSSVSAPASACNAGPLPGKIQDKASDHTAKDTQDGRKEVENKETTAAAAIVEEAKVEE